MSLVFLDTETAGLELTDPIIQLAAVAYSDWKEVDSFQAKLLFDDKTANPQALAINHYTPEAWKDAQPERVVVAEFAAFLSKHKSVELVSKKSGRPYRVTRIGGHNVQFDLDRIGRAFARWGIFLPVHYQRILDTRAGAIWYFENRVEQPLDMKLGTLAAFFNLDSDGAHDALVDARLSARLAQKLLNGAA